MPKRNLSSFNNDVNITPFDRTGLLSAIDGIGRLLLATKFHILCHISVTLFDKKNIASLSGIARGQEVSQKGTHGLLLDMESKGDS